METFYPIIPINRIKTPAKIKEISILTDFQVFHLFGTFFSTRSENLHFPIKFCCIVQFIADVILPGFPPFFYISIYVLFQDFFPSIYCFPFHPLPLLTLLTLLTPSTSVTIPFFVLQTLCAFFLFYFYLLFIVYRLSCLFYSVCPPYVSCSPFHSTNLSTRSMAEYGSFYAVTH